MFSDRASSRSTITDPTPRSGAASDGVIRLREWATDSMEVLPRPATPSDRIEITIGKSKVCQLRLTHPHVSGEHARMVHEDGDWKIYDLGSKNGLWLNGQECTWGLVRPGTEIGLGSKFILVAESARSIAMRSFLARILGWSSDRTKAVDVALRSIHAIDSSRTAFAVCSESDPAAIAYSLHRAAFGGERPFITCDPKRKSTTKSVRWTHNVERGLDALNAAAGGTLCVWASRLPRDYDAVWDAIAEPTTHVRLVVCSNKRLSGKRFLTVPTIVVPPLSTRTNELRHVISEYASDAISELGAQREHVRPEDLDWIHQHESASLAKIEVATLRLVALRMFPNVNQAAERLGMARVSLASWIGRRKLPMQIES